MHNRTHHQRHERNPAPRGQQETPLDARGTMVGHIESVDTELSFGHLEPTVLLHRTGIFAPSSHDSGPAHTGTPPTADREDGNG
jgi:hypothetical protein